MPHAKPRLLAATVLPIFYVDTERAIVVHYENGKPDTEETGKYESGNRID